MRISDWSSDVVLFRSRDRSGHAHPSQARGHQAPGPERAGEGPGGGSLPHGEDGCEPAHARRTDTGRRRRRGGQVMELFTQGLSLGHYLALRSEEHTSELQSLMRNSYAVFCLKKKKNNKQKNKNNNI